VHAVAAGSSETAQIFPVLEAFYGLRPDTLPRGPPGIGQPAALCVSHRPDLPAVVRRTASPSPNQVQQLGKCSVSAARGQLGHFFMATEPMARF
jgi:hypothetical protein